jgi:hypothetical protein
LVVDFTTDQAPGAMANGTRVRKVNSAAGDTHHDGAGALVLGSVGPALGRYGYYVEWDDHPGIPVFIASDRLEAIVVQQGST